MPSLIDDIARGAADFPQLSELAETCRHVTDWPEHEEKIARFWRNAILYERSYDGNPMRTHMQAGDVKAEHFAPWLMLFDETLRRTLPEDTAAGWSALAHRIGAGLRMGVEDLRERRAGAPILR